MQNTRYPLIILVSLILFLTPLYAKGRKDFTTYGPSVAGAAYGDAATAYCRDLTAYYYNPALLADFVQGTLTASHFILFDDDQYNFFAIGYPIGYGFFGLAAAVLGSGDIEVRKNIEDSPSIVHTSQYAFNMSFGALIEPLKLNVGANVKYLNFDLAGFGASALGLDLGFSKDVKGPSFWKQDSILLFGLNFRNLYQPKMKFIAEEEKLPTAITLGTAIRIPVFMRYNPKAQIFYFDKVVIATDFELNTDYNEFSFRPGIEYGFINRYFIRAGYRDNVTFGLGYHSDTFQFDYTLDPKPYSNMHKLGFTYYWGEPKEAPESEDFDKYRKTRLEAERLYDRQLALAQELADKKQFDEATGMLKYTIYLNPDNSRAKDLYKQIGDLKTARYLQAQNDIINDKTSKKNLLDAYKTALETLSNTVYDYDTQQKTVKIYNDIVTGSNASQIASAKQLRQDYLDVCATEINNALANNDFDKAGVAVQRLKAVDPDSYYTFDKVKLVENSKKNYVSKQIIDVEDSFAGKRYEEAFAKSFEGLLVDPDSKMLQTLKQKTEKTILEEKNFSANDKLYADRMYFLSAKNLANGEKYESRENVYTLIRFNPVHENGRKLYNFLQKEGIIK
ncbi:MAG: PorV/PorQ family protein [Elusimicrobiota bacterium]